MGERDGYRGNAGGLKAFSLLFLGLVLASLLLVHVGSYEPAVSFVLLYLVVCAGVTAAVALLLLPAAQFSDGFGAGAYALYAAIVAMMVFFSGGVLSELYVLFFPLLLAPGLRGSRGMVLTTLLAALFCYALAVLPGLLNDGAGNEAAPVFYRFCVLALAGLFALFLARGGADEAGETEDDSYATDEEDSLLLERVEEELAARKGVPVAVVLADPGGEVEDMGLLLDRVRSRIGDPVFLDGGPVFGLVLGGVDEEVVESAARRALAAASSLGAEETRAGVAIYPHDARSAEDLLTAAEEALESAFEVESPSAIVLAGRDTEGPHRAAR